MNLTPIEWTTYSVNPFKMRMPDGTLLNVCVHKSGGCARCYAESIVRRWWKKEWGEFPGYTAALLKLGTPVLVEKEIAAVLRLSSRIAEGKADPTENKIFWNDMTDEFLDYWPDEFIDKLFAVRALTPNLIHQVLTKRADRMRDYLNNAETRYRVADEIVCQIPRERLYEIAIGDKRHLIDDTESGKAFVAEWPLLNIHLGVSCEDQKTADERIPLLLRTPAAVRFVSYEPALGPVDLTRIATGQGGDNDASSINSLTGVHYIDAPVEPVCGSGLDWIIVGGESGPGARPMDLAWARSIVEQCKAAKVSCFVKQLGAKPILDCPPGEEGEEQFRDDGSARYWTIGFIKDKKGGNIDEFPDELKVREFPEAKALTN